MQTSKRRFVNELRSNEKVSANLERKEGLHCEARRAEKVSANHGKKVCIAKPEGLRKLVQTSKGERRFALRSPEG